VALVLIAGVAFFLRMLQANESLWVDELHTSWAVSGEWEDVAPRAYIGNQHPLYFWLVRGIVSIGGHSELSLRSISLLSGVGFVLLCGYVVRRFTGSHLGGIVAASLVAIDREFIYFSQEARTYSLVQLLGLVQLCCGYRLLYEAKLRWRVGFVFLSVALFYLHYTTGLLLMGELMAAIVLYRTQSFKPIYPPIELFCDLVLIGSVCLLTSHRHLREVFDRRLNWKTFVTANPRSDLLRHFDVYYLMALLVLIPATCWGLLKSDRRWWQLDPLYCSLILIAVAPISWAWYGTYMEVLPVFFYRYLVVLFCVGPLSVGIICARLPKWGVVVAILVIMFAGVAHARSTNWWRSGWIVANRVEEWRDAAELVDQNDNDWPVLLQSGFIETNKLTGEHEKIWAEFLSCPLRGIYRIEQVDERLIPGARNSMVFIQRHRGEIRRRGGGWLVIRMPQEDANKLASSLVTWVAFDIEVFSYSGVQVFKLTPSSELEGRVLSATD
jgi:mannosyltransferase